MTSREHRGKRSRPEMTQTRGDPFGKDVHAEQVRRLMSGVSKADERGDEQRMRVKATGELGCHSG